MKTYGINEKIKIGNKLEVGSKFTREDKKECTITSFFVFDSGKSNITKLDFDTFESAYKHYKTVANKRCSDFISVGLNYDDDFLGGSIDLIYNEVVKANNTDIFLYAHDVMTNILHSDLNKFKLYIYDLLINS